MKSDLSKELLYFKVGEGDLNTLFRGKKIPGLKPINLTKLSDVLAEGETGVLVVPSECKRESIKPIAVLTLDNDVRRLCGRFAHVIPDFAPLSTWCHLLKPDFFTSVDGVVFKPKLRNTVAAWSGLIVAETMLLSSRMLADVRISACLASTSYAIGRTKALWPHVTIDEIIDRFDLANDTCRRFITRKSLQHRMHQIRSSFVPLWICLDALENNSDENTKNEFTPTIEALKALQNARQCDNPEEASELVSPLSEYFDDVNAFHRFAEMVPETRLTLFDELVEKFKDASPKDSIRKSVLALLCGYLATKVAGGSASLTLVRHFADEFPQLIGWAYLVGSIGESITWTSGFDGLGRLVARELNRPFRLDESPTCDFSLDEAVVLIDKKLRDPLVHLKIKQARNLSVALFPGVNIAIPTMNETTIVSGKTNYRRETLRTSSKSDLGIVKLLSDILWPELQSRVVEEIVHFSESTRQGKSSYSRTRRKTPSKADTELPFTDHKE